MFQQEGKLTQREGIGSQENNDELIICVGTLNYERLKY